MTNLKDYTQIVMKVSPSLMHKIDWLQQVAAELNEPFTLEDFINGAIVAMTNSLLLSFELDGYKYEASASSAPKMSPPDPSLN